MYMYLSPLVSVVRIYIVHTHQGTRIRQIFWGVARYGMVIGIGIGMRSETDWKWSEK